MTDGQIIVLIVGIVLEFFIYWFFFGKKEQVASAGFNSQAIEIIVEGGYKPSTIILKKDKKALLRFIRKDDNSCLEEVVFPDYGIKKYLPLNTAVDIELKPPHATKTGFHCGMNMYQGRLVTE